MIVSKFLKMLCLPLLLLASACVNPEGVLTVKPVNEPEMSALFKHLRPVMRANGVVDQEGAWYTSRLAVSSVGDDVGARLLNRLSPAFRFPDMPAQQLPRVFKDMFTPEARIAVNAHSFTAMQGTDRIHVALLALLDWDRNGEDDWLVLCRIVPTTLQGSSRDYYLLITAPEAPVLNPRVLGLRDCRNNICEVYDSAGKSRMFDDINSLDYMPGDIVVTSPPVAPEKKNSGPVQDIGAGY